MKKLAHLTIAAALALTACGSDSGDAASTTAPTTTTVVWTDAMQQACVAEADQLDRRLDQYDLPGSGLSRPSRDKVSIGHLIDDDLIRARPTYWTVSFGRIFGVGDNEDERCGGIYLP